MNYRAISQVISVLCVMLGFHREVDENCTLLVYWAVSSGNFLPTSWDNLTVSSWALKMGPIGFPEISARNYHY